MSCDGVEVGVFKVDGQFVAWHNVCPHREGPVCQGRIYQRVVEPIAGDGTSGTTVHFMPGEGLRGAPIDLSEVARCARVWRHLDVELKTSAVEPCSSNAD